jgi:hypothetical protein
VGFHIMHELNTRHSICRDVVSVSTSWSRDGLETYPRSRLGLVSDIHGQRLSLGLGTERLGLGLG